MDIHLSYLSPAIEFPALLRGSDTVGGPHRLQQRIAMTFISASKPPASFWEPFLHDIAITTRVSADSTWR